MITPLKITREAAQKMTPAQLEAAKLQLGENSEVTIFSDFSLPDDYVAFIRTDWVDCGELGMNERQLFGGIDKEGNVST